MADVAPPVPGYRPFLPPLLTFDGFLSDAQLERVALAGHAHERLLPTRYRVDADYVRAIPVDEHGDPVDSTVAIAAPLSEPVQFRQGWMLGDGTGFGKGRQAASVILDRWLRGSRRALWISQSARLVDDARRDWRELGRDEYDIFPLADYRPSQPIPRSSGVLFTTYATLRSPARGKGAWSGTPTRPDDDSCLPRTTAATDRRGRPCGVPCRIHALPTAGDHPGAPRLPLGVAVG